MASVKSYLKMARECINQQDFEGALNACETVLHMEPDNCTGWIFKGLSLSKLNKVSEAVDSYERAIRIDSNNALGYQVSYGTSSIKYYRLTSNALRKGSCKFISVNK